MKSPRRSQYTHLAREVVRDFSRSSRVVCLAPSSKPSNHVDASGGVSDAPDDARIAAYRAGTSRSSSSNFRRKNAARRVSRTTRDGGDWRTDAADVGVRSPGESAPRRHSPPRPSVLVVRDPRPTARSRPPHPAIPTCLGVFSSPCAAAHRLHHVLLVPREFRKGGANASGGSAAAAVSAYSLKRTVHRLGQRAKRRDGRREVEIPERLQGIPRRSGRVPRGRVPRRRRRRRTSDHPSIRPSPSATSRARRNGASRGEGRPRVPPPNRTRARR